MKHRSRKICPVFEQAFNVWNALHGYDELEVRQMGERCLNIITQWRHHLRTTSNAVNSLKRLAVKAVRYDFAMSGTGDWWKA